MKMRAWERGDAGDFFASRRLGRVNQFFLLIGVLFAVAGAWVFQHTLYLTVNTHTNLMQWDEWDILKKYIDFVSGKTGALAYFWDQHNEHRVVLAKLIFLIDAQLFGGAQIFSTVFMVVFWVLVLALFIFVLARCKSLPFGLRLAGTGVLAGLLFSDVQIENLSRGFNNQVFTVMGFSIFAVYLLVRAVERKRTPGARGAWLTLAAALFSAICATGSMASGLAAWPTLLLVALLILAPRGFLASIVVVGTVMVTAYMWDYSQPDQTNPTHSIHQLAHVVNFFLAYFGNPAAPIGTKFGLLWLKLFGACAILLAAYHFVRRIFTYSRTSAVDWFLIGVCIYVVGVGVMVSLGRLCFGEQQAVAMRYSTQVVPLWAAVLLLGLTLIGRHWGESGWSRVRILDLGAVALAFVLCSSIFFIQRAGSHWAYVEINRNYEAPTNAIVAHAPDIKALTLAHPNPHLVLQEVLYLAAHRLSIFHDDTDYLLYRLISNARGQPLASFARTDGHWCSGGNPTLTETKLLASASDEHWTTLNGWAFDTEARRPVDALVFTDSQGRIVGIGRTIRPDWDVVQALHLPDPNMRLYYTGYVNVGMAQPVTGYAVSSAHEQVCRLSDAPHISDLDLSAYLTGAKAWLASPNSNDASEKNGESVDIDRDVLPETLFQKMMAGAQSCAALEIRNGHLLAHAPCTLKLQTPPNWQTLDVKFGMEDGTWEDGGNTVGACFIIAAEQNDGMHAPLFKRCLDPKNKPGDRGTQTAHLKAPSSQAPSIVFVTAPNGPTDWDWTYWEDAAFK